MDEAALVERLQKGDEAAFEDLVREQGGRMLMVARRYMKDDADAQDVVQDAFLSAFKAIGGFAGSARLSTWLHRIVVNAALMKLRTRRRHPEQSIEDMLPKFQDSGHHVEMPSPWDDRADFQLERKETRQTVRDAIDRLPDTYRTVLLLRDIEGLDTAEAAERLGITPNAAKVRLHRARLALRTALDRHFRVPTS